MKTSIRAAREEEARCRASVAAAQIGERLGLGDQAAVLAGVSEKDKDVERLRQWEATADLLDAVLGRLQDVADPQEETDQQEALAGFLAELDQVEGVGPKTVQAIRDHLAAQE